MIKKTDGGYAVFSHKTGKKMSKSTSKGKAKKRLAQIQYFKNKSKADALEGS